jgi:hypothetical protein
VADVGANGIEAHPFSPEDGGRNRSVLPKDSEQDVRDADVVM